MLEQSETLVMLYSPLFAIALYALVVDLETAGFSLRLLSD